MAQNPSNDPVTASEVRSVKFQLIRRGGYDPGQVDPFLEVVAQTLEGEPGADRRVDVSYVHNVRFTTVRRGGYLPTQVDDFLDRVIDTLNGNAASFAPVAPEHPEESSFESSEESDVSSPPPPPPAIVDAPPPTMVDTPPPPPPAEVAEAEPLADEPLEAAQGTDDDDLAADGADFSPEADFDRLRILHESGVVSDKEFAVLGARVKRRIDAKQSEDSSALV
ncbi:MAG: DivIVA domain-containing protein [Acidimicrobiales bacterium]